jgi:hypothetical protein
MGSSTANPRPSAGRAVRLCDARKFLEAFGLPSLRNLPDLERLKAERLLRTGRADDDRDDALAFQECERTKCRRA